MIHWITENLGTSSWAQVTPADDIHIMDVRDLVDKGGNTPAAVKAKIDEALVWLQRGEKVVVCCDYGISRSNAIAIGILATYENIPIEEAVTRVIKQTGETAIKLEVLSSVYDTLAAEIPRKSTAIDKDRLLVTGGSGFIGSSLLKKLKRKYEVVAPSHQEVDLTKDAIGLDLLVKKNRVGAILHLANPRIYTTNNSMGDMLIMLKNVLDVCVGNDLWLIFLSGWEIYSGYRAQELWADESLAPCPGGTYGQAKYLSETLIDHFHKLHGLRLTILRSSPVYGPGSDRPKFIWNFLQKARQDNNIVTHKYLNGFPRLDLLFIDDLYNAITATLDHEALGVFNIGTGVSTSTADIAQQIIELVGSRSTMGHIQIDGYTGNIVMDHGRARNILGWSPVIGLRQGLEAIINSDQSQRFKGV